MPENNNERSFSQDEVNRIVADRLKAERAKIMREAEQREAELNRRETLLTAKADWTRRGLPADLLDSIDLSKDGALEAAERVFSTLSKPSRVGFSGKQDIIGGDTDIDSGLRNAFGLNRKEG